MRNYTSCSNTVYPNSLNICHELYLRKSYVHVILGAKESLAHIKKKYKYAGLKERKGCSKERKGCSTKSKMDGTKVVQELRILYLLQWQIYLGVVQELRTVIIIIIK